MIEHKSVLEPVRRLEQHGRIRVTWLRPDPLGQVHPEALDAAMHRRHAGWSRSWPPAT